VGSVIASSPADLAGIEVVDYIIEIDGRPVAGIDVNRVISLLEQPAGTRLSLKLQRGAEMMERKLTLVSLI
jgi:C-terminal processing protease CtpA/Prc